MSKKLLFKAKEVIALEKQKGERIKMMKREKL